MAEEKTEKTEKATPRRLKEARDKGQVAKSKEVSSVAILLASLAIFYFFGGNFIGSINYVLSGFIADSGSIVLTEASTQAMLERSLKGIFFIMLPFLCIPIVALTANVLQTGIIFSADPITPKLSKLNPIEGFQKLFSATAAAEMLKTLTKFAVIGYIAYLAIRGEVVNFGQLADSDTMTILVYLGKTAFKILVKTSWVLIAIAIIDFIFQRWERERNLKMSKHEIKEEFKDTEGQPLVKMRIKTIQRQLSRQRMMQDVPTATVVVTNPTHFSIALRYDQDSMGAPTVVAKGQGHIALKIREIAKENGVPTVENKPLARTLWKVVEIGGEVPHDLYQAVAEVMAYVFKLKLRR